MANLNERTLARQRIPLPPLDEQESIVRLIVEESRTVDAARSRLDVEIELLREYRTCLIADAVTGKLDVREVAACLSDEAVSETVEYDTDRSDETQAADEEAIS